MERRAEPDSKTAKAESVTNARILVVDDEPVMVTLLTKAMSGEGRLVDTAASGEAAVSLLRRHRYDLLVVDKNLPGLNGVEVIRVARSVASQMGILLITAYASAESASELLPLHIDACVRKPFELAELMAQVEQILQRQAAKRTPSSTAPAKSRGAQTEQKPTPPNIIVVEQDTPCRRHILHVLREWGMIAHIHASPTVALRAMPEADGAVVAQNLCDDVAQTSLRHQRFEREVFRLVMLTDRASLDCNVLAILLGARAVLQRDADRGHVEVTLRSVLGDLVGSGHGTQERTGR